MRAKKPRVLQPAASNRIRVREFIELGESEYWALPERFVAELSCRELAEELIFNNFANVSVSAPGTERTIIEDIARSSFKPFNLDSLSSVFDERQLIRGRTYSSHVWKVIDQLAKNWPNTYWWYSERGLGMAQMDNRELAAKIKVKTLEPFDKLAGRLFLEGMKDGRVPDDVLLEIARALDAQGFVLKECLKPSDWDQIATYNQKYARKAIRTFETAIQKYPRGVRRRLSEAKRKYEAAVNA